MDCLFLYFPLLSFFLLSENVPLSLVYFPFETIFHLTSINGSYVLIHPAVFLTFSKSESVRMNILRILTGSGENEERSILFFCLFLLSFVAYLSLLCFFFLSFFHTIVRSRRLSFRTRGYAASRCTPSSNCFRSLSLNVFSRKYLSPRKIKTNGSVS